VPAEFNNLGARARWQPSSPVFYNAGSTLDVQLYLTYPATVLLRLVDARLPRCLEMPQ